MPPRRWPSRPLGRLVRDKAVAFPVIFSLVVHAALIAALVSWRLEVHERPPRLSEAGSSTTLNLTAERPPPPPVDSPRPEPKPTPPPPIPEPESASKAVETPAPTTPTTPAVLVVTKDDRPAPAPAPSPRPPRTEPAPVEPAPPPPETKVDFAGVESKRAQRLVYAIDASGSMASSLPFVKAELARSVAKLDPSQSFAVVVFREKLGGGESIETFAGSAALLAATPRAKADLARWISTIEPSGRSSPVAGLRAAFALKPDLVLFLTRNIQRSGGAPDANARTLAAIDSLNPPSRPSGPRPVVVKVVQFIEDDPTGLMQALAEAQGDGPGSYRVVPVQ